MPLLSSVACQNKEKHVIREGKSKSCKNNEKASTPIPLSSCLYTLVKCKAHTKVLVTNSPNNLVLNTWKTREVNFIQKASHMQIKTHTRSMIKMHQYRKKIRNIVCTSKSWNKSERKVKINDISLLNNYPANIYLFKVINTNTTKRREICSSSMRLFCCLYF